MKAKLKIAGVNIILSALLFGLGSLNKTFFRPTFNPLPFLKFLTGSFTTFN